MIGGECIDDTCIHDKLTELLVDANCCDETEYFSDPQLLPVLPQLLLLFHSDFKSGLRKLVNFVFFLTGEKGNFVGELKRRFTGRWSVDVLRLLTTTDGDGKLKNEYDWFVYLLFFFGLYYL